MALNDLIEERLFQTDSNSLVSRFSNIGGSNVFKGPTAKSLFYEAAKRTPGKYGQFLFYSLGSFDNDFINSYYRSESLSINKNVSSLASKNPSAGSLVRETANNESIASKNTGTLSGLVSSKSYTGNIVGGLSAPYYWKDFLYCKYYGTIPNNYMITLRRFPHPILDNLSVPDAIKSTESYHAEGAGRPVAQAVTWYGGNSGNNLNSILTFSTGLSWTPKDQEEMKTQEMFSKGIFNQDHGPAKWLGLAIDKAFPKLKNAYDAAKTVVDMGVIATDPLEELTGAKKTKELRDKAKSSGGVMSEYIFVPVDVVKKTQTRTVGLPFNWETLTLVFEYELTSVGEVNTKAAMLDILGNLLSMGTNYGNFLTPEIRYNSNFPAIGFPGGNAGMEDFYRDPIAWLVKNARELSNAASYSEGENDDNGDTSSDPENIKKTLTQIMTDTANDPVKLADSLKEFAGKLGTYGGRLLRYAILSDFVTNYIPPVSLLTGAPIGEWHLTVGNPMNPIAMIGNLICEFVKIEFNESLGPDDFPTGIKATFTLKHGRDRERGEIESIFNRGDGRLYQSSLRTSASAQSYAAFGDVNGNVLSESVKNSYLDGSTWQKSAGLPSVLGI